MKKIRIALLCGGFSTEREISLRSGEKIFENLDNKKYQVFLFDLKNDLMKFVDAAAAKKFDLAFPALHGPLGEDGTVQGLLEIFGLPYLFSGVLASALAMDKDATKKALKGENILMPRHIILDKNYKAGDLKKMRTPFIVKPVDQGSSIATFVVKSKKDIEKTVKKALKISARVMAEEFIPGREITAAVLGNEDPVALPLVEIRPKASDFFDYRAKYESGASDEICPAPIDKKLTENIQKQAIAIHRFLGCRGVTRSDFIINGGRPYFLEINTIPGMTETSLVPLAAAAAGLPFKELLDKLITSALDR